jgi:fructose-specific phosphotransferase system IIA component
MSKPVKPASGKVTSLLSEDAIKLGLQATEKNAALREVAELLHEKKGLTNFDAFFKEILERERVSNTALGHDIAIPHARTEQCTEILMAVGRSAEGIDFGAKDGQPVRLIFLIGTPKQMVTEYLRVVGNLARLLRQDDLRRQLLEVQTPVEFSKLLEDAEA